MKMDIWCGNKTIMEYCTTDADPWRSQVGPFGDLTLPRSGRAGRVTRSPLSEPVVTFATFNPRRPAQATIGVRTVTSADQESVV